MRYRHIKFLPELRPIGLVPLQMWGPVAVEIGVFHRHGSNHNDTVK